MRASRSLWRGAPISWAASPRPCAFPLPPRLRCGHRLSTLPTVIVAPAATVQVVRLATARATAVQNQPSVIAARASLAGAA